MTDPTIHLTSIYSEDIRQEATGQTTVVGWFTSSRVQIAAEGEQMLPKLCVTGLLSVPKDGHVEVLRLELMFEDSVLQAVDLPSKALVDLRFDKTSVTDRGVKLTVGMQLNNFAIPGAGVLRLVAIVDGVRIEGNGLRFVRATSTPESQDTSRFDVPVAKRG